jgi:integrase
MICLTPTKPGAKPPSLTLRQFFDDYYRPKRLIGCSPRTIEEYENLLRRTEEFAGRQWYVRDLTDDMLEKYMSWRLLNHRAKATVNKDRACLVALANFATRRKMRREIGRENSPRYQLDVEKLKAPKRTPESWAVAELELIIEKTHALTGTIYGTPAGVWWRAIICFAYYTGYRIDTIVRLKASAYKAKSCTLLAPAELQKHGADDQRRLPQLVCDLLNQIQPHSSGRLFPYPYTPKPGKAEDERRRARCVAKTIRLHFRKLMESAGLTTRRWLFHKLRATHATELDNENGNAQRSLGHSGQAVTDRYIDPTKSRKPTAAELLPAPRLSPPNFRLLG